MSKQKCQEIIYKTKGRAENPTGGAVYSNAFIDGQVVRILETQTGDGVNCSAAAEAFLGLRNCREIAFCHGSALTLKLPKKYNVTHIVWHE